MKLAQKIDGFSAADQSITLWLMPNDKFLITVKDIKTDVILEKISSRDSEGISLKFDELRQEKTGIETLKVVAKEQFDLFPGIPGDSREGAL